MIRRPPRSTRKESSAASDVYKRQIFVCQPHRKDEVAAIANDQGVEHVLTLGVNGEGSLMSGAQSRSGDFVPVPCADEDLAAILYTSCTTGKPKGAMMTQMNLWSNAATLEKLWGFDGNDILLHALPIFHTHGLFIACHCVMLSGAVSYTHLTLPTTPYV